jgi:tricorn protease
VDLAPGDVLLAIDGVPTLSVPHPHQLLRDKAGHQTLLEVRPADGGEPRQVIVYPISPDTARDLRYGTWERERRERVEELGDGRIGYVHLRAMGGRNYEEWARNYFPVFHRQGLIVDVRQNRGGNIDSWILGNLVRRPWMWWKSRTGIPYRNMQYAFGGHLVVLCDEFTRSDGEAFAEGFRRLGLGQVIGTRTWGGEVWLTSSNRLVDGGIATAAEFGVYGPEGEWLIEGHGVVPDLEVDNLPHATFQGQDAQLEAAVDHLLELIERDPPRVPEPPPYPDKSWHPPEP